MRIILDTDPGIDDALAFLYLAANNAHIEAVGTVHGNVPARQGAANALRILARIGRTDVPVAIGAARPLAQALHTAEFVHGTDGLGGHAGAPPTGTPVAISAAEQLVRLARSAPGELTLLAMAPVTNLALALLLEPELPALLRSVVLMGGAVDVPGNITPFAEANIWHDPEAAELVFGAGFNLTLVGLDVTQTEALADAAWLEEVAAMDTPAARFASTLLEHYTDFYATLYGERGAVLHDPLAAAILLDPELASYRQAAVEVELRGRYTRGQTLVDQRPLARNIPPLNGVAENRRPVRIASRADGPEFRRRMIAALR